MAWTGGWKSVWKACSGKNSMYEVTEKYLGDMLGKIRHGAKEENSNIVHAEIKLWTG